MKTAFLQALALCGLSLVAGAMLWAWHPASPRLMGHTGVRGAETAAADGVEVDLNWVKNAGAVQWVDARRSAEFQQGRIPGAWNIHPGNLEAAAFDYFEKAQALTIPVVVYCRGEICEASHLVREVMAGWGLSQEPKVLGGGWPAWVEAGGEVER